MDLFRFFRSMYDVGCQFVKKEDGLDLKVTNQETSTVSIEFSALRFVYSPALDSCMRLTWPPFTDVLISWEIHCYGRLSCRNQMWFTYNPLFDKQIRSLCIGLLCIRSQVLTHRSIVISCAMKVYSIDVSDCMSILIKRLSRVIKIGFVCNKHRFRHLYAMLINNRLRFVALCAYVLPLFTRPIWWLCC